MEFFNFNKPSISDLSFHKESWELYDNFDTNISWFTEERDAARLQLFNEPYTWPFDLGEEAAARTFFENQSIGMGGALIQMNVEEISGLESLVGIFKYRSPVPDHMRMFYIAVIWIPFKEFCFQINFESLETDPTGAREAAVSLIEIPTPVESDEEPELITGDELFARMGQSQIVLSQSDDPKYDAGFPEHPLTKVRSYIQHLRDNLVINKDLLKQKRHRLNND